MRIGAGYSCLGGCGGGTRIWRQKGVDLALTDVIDEFHEMAIAHLLGIFGSMVRVHARDRITRARKSTSYGL